MDKQSIKDPFITSKTGSTSNTSNRNTRNMTNQLTNTPQGNRNCWNQGNNQASSTGHTDLNPQNSNRGSGPTRIQPTDPCPLPGHGKSCISSSIASGSFARETWRKEVKKTSHTQL
jgi:hypothetical protein